jgi:hypothetical protein
VLDSVIGSVVPGSARIENGRGIARVRFSDRAEVEPLWKDVEAGHIRAVSIGYQVHRFDISELGGRKLYISRIRNHKRWAPRRDRDALPPCGGCRTKPA